MKLSIFLIAIGLFAFFVNCEEKVRFDGHKVLHINVTSEVERRLIESLELDIWSHDSRVIIGPNHIRVSPEQKELLEKLGFTHRVFINDVQKLIDQEEEENLLNQQKRQTNYFDSYHTVDEIYSRLQTYASTYSFVDISTIGTSHQGRPIRMVTFKLNTNANKASIFISGSMHAREWISAPTVQWIMEQLLDGYSNNDPDAMFLLQGLDFYFVPVINPDGLEYTKTNNRLWRKNRRQNSATVFGVDLNRNFDIEWGKGGSSTNPSSDTYMGPSVASEPETQAIQAAFDALSNPVGAIDYHSYSQLILRAWGYTTSNSPGEVINRQVGDAMRQAILANSGRSYTNQKSVQLYITTGSAGDYYYDRGYKKSADMLAYTFELRDTGQYGFVLPPSQIIPTGQENWDAFKIFAETTVPGNSK